MRPPHLPRLAVAGVCVLAVLGLTPAAGAAPSSDSTDPSDPHGRLALASLADDGSQPDAHSRLVGPVRAVSDDGRYVVLSTTAALVPADRNDSEDVYRRDTVAGTTTLVSATRSGAAGNGASTAATVSADGTRVAFVTEATDLIAGRDRNGVRTDVVVRDLATGRTTLASVDGRGAQRRADSFAPAMSADGRHVAMQTFATLTRDDRDRREDVYVRDTAAGTTRKASYTPRGGDVTTPVAVGTLSDDGRLVAFGDDHRVWVRDLRARRTTQVWTEEVGEHGSGTTGRPVLSGDGRFVVLHSTSPDAPPSSEPRVSVFRVDLATGEHVEVPRGVDGRQPDGDSYYPSVSSDGRIVAFVSVAGNLTADDAEAGDHDVFYRDLLVDRTYLLSRGSEQDPYDDSGRNGVSVSGGGDRVVFDSYDDSLVADDRNGFGDVLTWLVPT